MAADPVNVLMALSSIGITGFICATLIHVLDIITNDGYKSKAARKREAAVKTVYKKIDPKSLCN